MPTYRPPDSVRVPGTLDAMQWLDYTHTHTLLVLLQPSSNQEETWMSHARSGADRNGRMNERTNKRTNEQTSRIACPRF